ncbi:filamentous hemagglutinin N-terminal domain-containing protein [Chroococcidiopsis sp. FACHB-1243]|uniref:two-partner secretion domain-containing protein n=1 Tax=Chroococcidiopsis sp. [FACHB-1243] TaxID=2692781 RepID=UPI00177F8859|nr:filamentous hemagglutinin N-terminal domain-containing protein [Chroococcidiopsis sp. [FACHB-1243]]MBD2304062.1 filamentous hemagglutinin N-terminal domain-containing protein [Chroococcidiopsis sp. [FACHB-1243]]
MASVIGINLNIFIEEMYLQISSVSGRWCVRLGLAWAIVGSAIAFGSTALAQVPPDSQIVPDSTLGADNSIVNSNPNGLDTISGGATRGSNLFHSFDRFSIPDGRAALFNNGADIQNIITRVTGGSVSNIDGILATARDTTANLFLLNPNGIVFGQNASLRIGGSFIATTARSLNFADGTQFSATPGTGAPLLTVSVPLGLQFGTGAGEIVNRASTFGLQVGTGRTLGLIGGNVNLEGGRLTAAGGRIELGAVAAPGVIGINPDPSGFRFSYPTNLVLGDISLTADASVSPPRPTLVDVRAGGGGSIALNSNNLTLRGGSEIVAGIGQDLGASDAVAGDIDINAQGTVAIDGVGTFPDGVFSSGIFNNVNEGGTGKGGNINVKTGSLLLTNEGVISASIFGNGDTGAINITATEGISLDRSTIFGTVEETGRGNGGDIIVKARSLSLANGARLTTTSEGQGNAGNIDVQVQDSIFLDNSNLFSNVGNRQATTSVIGNVGNIRIKAKTITLANGSQIQASFLPNAQQQGNPGIVSLEATESIFFAGRNSDDSPSAIFTDVESGAVANGSDLQISAPIVSMRDGLLNASSAGQGNAGSVTITASDRITFDEGSQILSTLKAGGTGRGGDILLKARSLSLTNRARINASTLGTGDAGSVSITADDRISLDNSSIFSDVAEASIGKGGSIDLKTGSLLLTNSSVITANTQGQGDAGNIQITATNPSNSVIFESGSYVQSESFSQSSAGNVIITADGQVSFNGTGSNGVSSGVFSRAVTEGGIGQGGDISIKARSLSLTEGAQIDTSTSGQGNAGNIQIIATDPNNSVSFSGGSIIETSSSGTGNAGNVTITADGDVTFDTNGITSSLLPIQLDSTEQILQVPSDRRGGDINIKARSLFLTNSAQLNTNTFSQGNAGNINIDVSDTVSFDGVVDIYPSAAFSSVEEGGIGNGGDITIKARSLSLTNGGQLITSTRSGGQGNAGNINIEISDTVSFDGFGGEFTSAAFSNVEQGGIGNGGNITIKARLLSITNGAQVNASNFGQGNAGNIDIGVRTLDLDNGDIFAESTSGNGGNIELRASKSVRLRSGSQISTSAGGTEQGGNGGNITINSPLVIANANGNNDITANAFRGSGGRIEINAQGIFGLTRIDGETLPSLLGTDTPSTEVFERVLNERESNDVAAISLTDPSLGNVSFNADYIDPSRDIVELPTGLVDASSLVASGCPSGAENRFTVAGRGGLPPAPADKLSSDALLTDWATLQTPETQNRVAVETTTPVATNTTPTPPAETITEATSWQYDRNGAIILTSGDTTSPSHLKTTPTSCPSS